MAAHPIDVRQARPDELDAVATTAARAYADEAVARWMLPDAGSESGGENYMTSPEYRAHLKGYLDAGEIVIAEVGDRIVGTAIWQLLPDASRPRAEARQAAPAAAAEPDGLGGRLAELLRSVAHRHPDRPHHYLYAIGVLPELRGSGVGSVVLTHLTAAADAAGSPVYLEASDPRNQALYRRHGFVAAGPPITLTDGPALQPMWREAGNA